MLRVALAQLDLVVGDIEGNARRIASTVNKAQRLGADLVVFPELSVTSYPPEDLLLKREFVERNMVALERLAGDVVDIVAVVGFAHRKEEGLYNAAALLHRGRIVEVYHKHELSVRGFFDERRYFLPGDSFKLACLKAVKMAINISDDLFRERPLQSQVMEGASLIINMGALPYYLGKTDKTLSSLRELSRKYGCLLCHVNLVGGQDEFVFDGQSVIVNEKGEILARAPAFKEDLLLADISPVSGGVSAQGNVIHLSCPSRPIQSPIEPRESLSLGEEEEIYEALKLGLSDYVRKNGFEKVGIGLSGGIDSALVAVIAVDALGSGNVVGVFMPSRYTSERSKRNVIELSENLGIQLLHIPIDSIFESYLTSLQDVFRGKEQDVTEENIQARIRGNIMMALSNKFGFLPLTTGNKSEMSVGYATLYGDMAGGFAVLKDVPKTLVYRLARFRNRKAMVIPEDIFLRPPSAELRENQKDEDTLPPYGVLDPILRAYVEEDRDIEEIVAMGFDERLVTKILSLVDRNEYKRRQAPPGIRISTSAFGTDKRMPITNRFNR